MKKIFLTEKAKMYLTEATERTEMEVKNTRTLPENICAYQNIFRQHYLSLSVPSVSSSELGERVRATPNSGVALIMVLGLLTVMVLMAVTFAITMRTERLAAGNYADTVRARELVQVGLARAMNDLATNLLGTNGLSGMNGKMYPSWSVTNSYTNLPASTFARWSTNIYLVKGEATNYVPWSLWDDATNADLTNPSNHWLAVESLIYTNDLSGNKYLSESNLMGRVAYLIINCSGLLDANYAGGQQGGALVSRGIGTNPIEIAIANLGEIGTTAEAISFLTNREHRVRYETLHELKELNPFVYSAGGVSNLFVYSRALPGYWNTNPPPYGYGSLGTQVNLSGFVPDLTNRMSAITNAFAQIGFSAFESGVLFSNLIDYVDADSIPSNFEYCVESVPMINEVVVECNVTFVPGGSGGKIYTVTGNVKIELWYPFVNAPDPLLNFELNSSATFSDLLGIMGVSPFTFPPQNITPVSAGGFIQIPPLPFSFPAPSPEQIPSARIDIKSIISISVKSVTDNKNVDQLLMPIVITNYHDGVAASNTYADIECLDPRFNANPADANQWKQMGNTNNISLGIANTWTKSFLSSANNDGDGAIFVSNGPLRSVAELGYLVYTNAPWKTVKLYGPTCHRVLDVFGLSTNTSDVLMTNTVYRGRVNCNTNVASNATAVVFAGMPVDQYPGETPAPPTLTMMQAQEFASTIFGKGVFTNLSDIGYNLTAFPAGTTELQKESYFRNAFNLLNLRQNVFTIIIEAQAASGGNIPKNPAKQRAVAIVWRDPYTGEMFIRHIKWLGD